MRGFLVAALALVVVEVAGRNPDRIAGGLGAAAAAVRRALSPGVAGLRDFAGAGAGRAPEPTTAVPGRPPRTGRQVSRPGQPVAQ